ncbi:MAG: hypothetical protein DME42_09035 [Verrucomicrobia bacterium]|nr:MAG: hypothetical protein DME42_09035 [Verrucomicrobiota bacterium]
MIKSGFLCNVDGLQGKVARANIPSASRLLNRQVMKATGQHHRMFFKVPLAIETMAKGRKGKKYRP